MGGVIETALLLKLKFFNYLTMLGKRKSVAQGAATTVYCTLKPGLESESGHFFNDSFVNNQAAKFSDDEVNELWNWTEKVIRERTVNIKLERVGN